MWRYEHGLLISREEWAKAKLSLKHVPADIKFLVIGRKI